jgi:hypothetical protein
MKLKILTLFLLMAVFFASPVLSMSWKDKIWKESGCPTTVSGQWIPDNPDTAKHELFLINNNQVAYKSKNKETIYFKIIGKQNSVGERYVYIQLSPKEEGGKPNIIKVRPHLVHPKLANSKGNCSIKVFNFDTERHAKTDQYLSWAIYRLKN